MGIISFKEYSLSQDILNGYKTLFAINSEDINGITIGGTYDKPTFLSYPILDNEKEVMILEAKYDGDRYYFKPLFSDDNILIFSEDYDYGDSDELCLGEISTSNNRFKAYRRGIISELDLDLNYIYENRDLIMDNPLGVYLTSLEPLSSIPNGGTSMIDYNLKYTKDLERKLARMKLKAEKEVIEAYQIFEEKSYKKTK